MEHGGEACPFGKLGEWAEPRVLTVQFFKASDRTRGFSDFSKPEARPSSLPEDYESGDAIMSADGEHWCGFDRRPAIGAQSYRAPEKTAAVAATNSFSVLRLSTNFRVPVATSSSQFFQGYRS